MMKRLIAVFGLFFALMGLGTVAANAAPAPDPTQPTYTLDAQGFQTRGDVAALWSKNTGVNLVVGSCASTDPFCIHATVGNLACGTAGCATYDADACEVQVAEIAMKYGKTRRQFDTQFNVLGHEVGHCILHSSWHATDTRDIMQASVSLGAPRRTITSETKAQLDAYYGP